MTSRPLLLLGLGAAIALSLAITPGCGPSPRAAAPPKDFDVCDGSPPVPHPYAGLLRNARCDQHMYTSMASVATQLGVECSFCHLLRAGSTKPNDYDYPVMTPKKQIANWMSLHMMQAVKPADGSAIRCKSCHTDGRGNPIAKILGEPRDPVKAAEWMSLVMVRKFVAADGSKLRCKSCHGGAPGSDGFQAKVILTSDRLPPHAEGVKGTPSL